MKIKLFFLAATLFFSFFCRAQIYTGKSYEISFFSHGPIEDIAATSKSAQVMLNTAKNEIAVKVTIKGFEFEKKLMQEHFNEKYMESDKFPYATFSGKIKDTIDYKKDGVYKVSVTGKLNIHGVEKERTIPGTITVKGGEITIDSKFPVALKDHNIEIPSLVTQNIAEIVETKINSTLTEFNPKK
ncbi:MAG: YceI family protein [Bacteroidetes bacterium]|nr:YceI family protein [Bacteroidota bacterium]